MCAAEIVVHHALAFLREFNEGSAHIEPIGHPRDEAFLSKPVQPAEPRRRRNARSIYNARNGASALRKFCGIELEQEVPCRVVEQSTSKVAFSTSATFDELPNRPFLRDSVSLIPVVHRALGHSGFPGRRFEMMFRKMVHEMVCHTVPTFRNRMNQN